MKCNSRTIKGTPDIRKSYLQPLSYARECDKSVIILGGRQFTIFDNHYVEENINITDGYLWFIQYDNSKEISLPDFRLFMSKLNSSETFNFNDALNYIGISFGSIPQIGLNRCYIYMLTSLRPLYMETIVKLAPKLSI